MQKHKALLKFSIKINSLLTLRYLTKLNSFIPAVNALKTLLIGAFMGTPASKTWQSMPKSDHPFYDIHVSLFLPLVL